MSGNPSMEKSGSTWLACGKDLIVGLALSSLSGTLEPSPLDSGSSPSIRSSSSENRSCLKVFFEAVFFFKCFLFEASTIRSTAPSNKMIANTLNNLFVPAILNWKTETIDCHIRESS